MLAFGASAYLVAPMELSPLLTGFSIVVVVCVWLACSPLRSALRYGLLLLITFLTGFAACQAKAHLVRAPVLLEQMGPVQLEGKLEGIEAARSAGDVRLRISVRAIEGWDSTITPLRVRVTQRQATQIQPGRSIACRVLLSPPPAPVAPGDYDFQRQAWFQQLGAVGLVLGECHPAPIHIPSVHVLELAKQYISNARRELASHVYQRAGPEAGGLAAAMIAGDRSYMSVEDVEALRGSGLAHLMAISGMHMGLAAGIFFFGLKRALLLVEPLALRLPPDKIAAIGALMACTSYLLISGASVATQRAFIMTSVALSAVLMNRSAVTMKSLAVAMIIVVLIQPETVVTPGFQMSFAATAALIALYEDWPNRFHRSRFERWRGRFFAVVATSVTASLATAPFSAFHFGRVAEWGILANIVASPVLAGWTTPTAALAIVTSPFGGDSFFLGWVGKSLELIQTIAREASVRSTGTQLALPHRSVFISQILALALFAILRNRWKLLSLPVAAGGLIVWSFTPTASVILTTDQHVYVKTKEAEETILQGDEPNGQWQFLSMPHSPRQSSLRPMSFQTKPGQIDCGTACEIQLNDNSRLRFMSRANGQSKFEILSHTGDGFTHSFLTTEYKHANAVAVAFRGKRAVFRTLRMSTGRPWRQPLRYQKRLNEVRMRQE